MSDEQDANGLDATLSFVEEFVAETFSSNEIPALSPSPSTFSSLTSRFPDATRCDFYEPVTDPTVMLAETLAMVPLPRVDQCNHAAHTGPKQSQPTSKKRSSTKPRKPQANPNRVRNELRFELAYLREKAAQLEQELSSLQKKQQANSDALTVRRQTPTVIIVPHGGLTQEHEAWKGIAARQRMRREGAERENSRLRIIVEKQRKIAVDLANLLRKRVAESSQIKDPHTEERRLSCVLDFHGDIGEFRELFGHLEAAYSEVDTVLAANGLATMELPTNDVHIREGVDGKYLEFFANKVVPFGLHETAEAAWDHFKGADKHCGNGGIYEKAAKNLDQPYTVLEDFTKELYSNSSRADMKAKQIVRRYIEAEREIVVFVSRVSPTEIRHKAIEGMTYHLRGYVVTKPSPASSPGHELTMLQFCSRISIDKQPGIIYDREHIRTVIRFLIGNTVGNIRCYQERIENSLIDKALQQ
ncbi:hypothetical protein F442_20674 [Phytophthora nicotianae P10297]|uniref:M96 mating-specific protein family n=1 Tax=Phytophthora nicotianae P10297 TaxID=1317064 RepID=W2Y7X8_PHYNI|nr:hypothetical protein F442_20674 [Phytophthora nicotianae P10297]